jgi:RNA polymerase sigma factor (sigma-70 family)
MIQDRQVRVKALAGTSSVKPGAGSDQLFQVTLLLPPRCRDVFVLTEMHGYTMPEVAKVLGISKDSVEKHLRRALREMQIS